MGMREEFEAWYIRANELTQGQGEEHLVQYSDSDGIKKYWPGPQALWEAWQASREAVVIALPPTYNVYLGSTDEAVMILDDVTDEIKSHGLKVKS